MKQTFRTPPSALRTRSSLGICSSLRSARRNRRGAALVLLLLFLIPLIAFLALAIDMGLLAVARTQCQNAADVAALAGVRTLNGNPATNNNYAAVTPAAQSAVTANTVLATPLQTSQVTVNIGRYAYNTSTKQFEGQLPGSGTSNWSLVQSKVTLDVSQNMVFSRVLGLKVPTLQATATAVHRPRDVALILDYSGSMRFATYPGVLSGTNNYVNNADTNVPQFGHYSAAGAGSMYATSFSLPYQAANVTATTSDGRPPLCADFYQNSGGTPAFVPAPASYATTPGGDNYLTVNKNSGGGYAYSVTDLLNNGKTYDSNFETQGYAAYSMAPTFYGYTQGPGYYGKTFFIWPPNPVNDWRKKYFTYPGSTTPMDDNSRLWSSSTGGWQAPGFTYSVNYNAILNFIKNVGPNPFPTQLQSGRIVYYTAIPDTIDTSSDPPTDLNQRFWKDYIDYVLGACDLGAGFYLPINTPDFWGLTGYGSDVAWGTPLITPKSSLSGNPKPYMNYSDNPKRPKLNFWFGPLTMVDFLENYTLTSVLTGLGYPAASRYCWWPGTCHEAPMYGCKLGIQAALNDIYNNHPNDYVSMIMFSVPKQSPTDNSGARFNRVRVGMGQNYQNMQDSLWYPPATVGVGGTVTPYDPNNLEVPRAYGGTCYAMPLMLAYNQFSASPACLNYTSPVGDAGGNGRKGAQKIIIFETDGAPNFTASATLINGGPYQSYYSVRYNMNSPGGSEFPTGVSQYGDNDPAVTSQIYTICQQLAASDTASPPGYSSGSHKLQLHCIGFGPLFAPGSSQAAACTNTLNQMQVLGNVTDGMPSYKIVYGDQNTVITSLQQSINKILESTIPVSLIQ